MAEHESSEWLASVRTVSDGATFHFVVRVIVTLAGFALNLLLTRTLGLSLYGVYTYGQKILEAVLLFANLGSDVSVTKYLSANTDDAARQNRMLGLSYLTSLGASVVVGAALFVAAPALNAATLATPELTPVLRLFAVSLPFQAVTRIAANAFSGLERPKFQMVVKVVRPTVRLTAIGLAVAAGYSLFGVTAAFLVACVLVFAFSVWLVNDRTHLRPAANLSRGELKEYYDFSLPLTMSRAGSLLYNRVDHFMVGVFLTSGAVGVYNIALLVAAVIAIPLAGFNQLFPPVASRLYVDDDWETLSSVYGTVTRWSITVSLIIAAPIVLYRAELLAVFGEGFSAGTTVLALFALGQFVNSVAGPSNDVLTMTDHQYAVLINHWTFGVLNVVLNYLFIQMFGLTGAALATAGVLATLNVVRVVEVWYFEGLFAYSRRLWKPVAAGAGAVVVMLAARLYLDGVVLVAVGGAAGVVTYGALLYALGIERRDKRLANEYLGALS